MSDALDQATSPRIGHVVAGKYLLKDMLGAGSMGFVWRAVHVVLGHSVAVKLLRQSLDPASTGRARFEQEAKLSARLGEMSSHIARVSDYGVLDNGTPFVVMELLRGECLAARLAREPALPLTTAATIVAQLARALSVAHRAGVIHRDLKPGNVFLCETEEGREPHVKLLDFGVAKLVEDETFQPTCSGEIVGTPSYMSPEQIEGTTVVDVRTDLWALAAMVYRMTVGSNAFGLGTVMELAFRISSTEHVPPSQMVSTLPRELDAWMARGLAKRREDRFASARELSDALGVVAGLTPPEPTLSPVRSREEEAQRETVGPAPPAPPAPAEGTISVHLMSSPPDMTARALRLRPVFAGGLGAIALVALVALLWSKQEKTAPARASVASVAIPASAAIAPAATAALVAPTPTEAPAPALPHAELDTAPLVAPAPPAAMASAPRPAPASRKGRDRAAHGKRAAPAEPAPGANLEKQSGDLWRKHDEL